MKPHANRAAQIYTMGRLSMGVSGRNLPTVLPHLVLLRRESTLGGRRARGLFFCWTNGLKNFDLCRVPLSGGILLCRYPYLGSHWQHFWRRAFSLRLRHIAAIPNLRPTHQDTTNTVVFPEHIDPCIGLIRPIHNRAPELSGRTRREGKNKRKDKKTEDCHLHAIMRCAVRNHCQLSSTVCRTKMFVTHLCV